MKVCQGLFDTKHVVGIQITLLNHHRTHLLKTETIHSKRFGEN